MTRFPRNDPLAWGVNALLGKCLILELDRGDPRRLEAANRVVDVEEAAIAGVGIGDQRRLACPRHRRHAVEHLGVTDQASVRQAIGRSGGPVAAAINHIEPDLVGDNCGDHIVNAGDYEEPTAVDLGAQTRISHAIIPLSRATTRLPFDALQRRQSLRHIALGCHRFRPSR